MSILRNFSVICGHRQIGLLQNVSLDEAQKQVLALIVSCGIRGKRVILPESIEAMLKKFDEINKKDKKAKSSAETGNHPNSEKLEKISAELFEYCPENAKYIAVNQLGFAFWFSEKPEIDSEHITWKSNGGEGGFVTGSQRFDASDWEHSLIEKEKN